MTHQKIFQCLDRRQRRSIFQLLKKHNKKLSKVLVVVIYTIGSIQNKYQQRSDNKSNGDYGRRWRQALHRMIEARQDEFMKDGVLIVHVDPTRLDTVVSQSSMKVLQPKLRRLQERQKFAELYDVFNPIRMKEIEVLVFQEKNVLVIAVVHFAEVTVSGGSAQELIIAEALGVPTYLYSAEDIIEKYKSRHPLMDIEAIRRYVVKNRNIFHTAEDALNRLLKDIPKLRKRKTVLTPMGRLLFDALVLRKKG